MENITGVDDCVNTLLNSVVNGSFERFTWVERVIETWIRVVVSPDVRVSEHKQLRGLRIGERRDSGPLTGRKGKPDFSAGFLDAAP